MILFKEAAHKSKVILADQLEELYADLQPSNAPFLETNTQKAMFIAQLAHETGGFRWLEELGGKSYCAKYDNRLDLGNTEAGDGYKYRGRGLIMITGRYNYKLYGDLLGFDLINYPDLAKTPEIALLIAFKYWEKRNLASYEDNVKKVTRLINGGYNHLKEREDLFFKLLGI